MRKYLNIIFIIILVAMSVFCIYTVISHEELKKQHHSIKKVNDSTDQVHLKMDSIFYKKDTLTKKTIKKSNQIIKEYEEFEQKTNNTKFTDVFLDSFLSELKKRAKLQGFSK